MHCIVTAGPTYEPLDEVRRLTNFSTGRLGSELVNFLAARGHEVTLLIGEQATWRGERHARRVETFTTTSTVTIWSPRCSGRPAFSTPRSRKRSFCPLCVPGGIFNCARPSMVGTSTFAPREASGTVTGTVR